VYPHAMEVRAVRRFASGGGKFREQLALDNATLECRASRTGSR